KIGRGIAYGPLRLYTTSCDLRSDRCQRNMELDTKKIDDVVLALLYLGLHDGSRAWKGFDWEAMNRLHERGYITEPRGKAKSVVFTEEGLVRAERLLEQLFGKQGHTRR